MDSVSPLVHVDGLCSGLKPRMCVRACGSVWTDATWRSKCFTLGSSLISYSPWKRRKLRQHFRGGLWSGCGFDSKLKTAVFLTGTRVVAARHSAADEWINLEKQSWLPKRFKGRILVTSIKNTVILLEKSTRQTNGTNISQYKIKHMKHTSWI